MTYMFTRVSCCHVSRVSCCHVPRVSCCTCDGLCLGAGVLVLVINYTGDRIHFGLATERAREEGLKVGPALVAFSSLHGVMLSSSLTFLWFLSMHGFCSLTYNFLYARLFYYNFPPLRLKC